MVEVRGFGATILVSSMKEFRRSLIKERNLKRNDLFFEFLDADRNRFNKITVMAVPTEKKGKSRNQKKIKMSVENEMNLCSSNK